MFAFHTQVILETIRAEETPSSNGVYETTNVIINAGLADLFHKMLSATPEPEGFAIQNMRFVSACMCNATKRSSTFCENLVAKSIPREILKYLKTEKLDPEQHKELMGNEDVRTCVINLMCILHNVMKVCLFLKRSKNQEYNMDIFYCYFLKRI